MAEYLKKIKRVLVDRAVEHTPLARRVRQRLSHLPWQVVDKQQDIAPSTDSNQVLYLKEYKGKFLRFCPGTRYYRCCGYRIIHIGENCPLNCTYCILRAYFQDKTLKVWANQNDLWNELDQAFGPNPDHLFRVGTGEFTDSLVLEPITGYSQDLVQFLAAYPNVCLELKTKIVDLSWVESVKRTDRVLPAWSLNSPDVYKKEEIESAPLEERLKAARECARLGFRVCLHFDPIIHYPGWEKGYAQIIEMIFDYLEPENIAYFSLGSFRCMPDLFKIIARESPHSTFIYNEFITGLDGKQRLLLPLRLKQFLFIARKLKQKGLNKQLYFCMESDQVWKKVMGYTPGELGGLNNHLLKLAFGVLV